MNDDNLHPDDELLSAYLDGELTAEERAQVEARLAADPPARALLEELRSLSATVQSLPRKSVPRDMLAGMWSEVERAQSGASSPTVERSESVATEHRQGFRRGLAWGAFALAATLLLALFLPQANRDAGEVAVKSKAPAAEAPRPQAMKRELGVEADVAEAEKDASAIPAATSDLAASGLKEEAKPAAAPAEESHTLAREAVDAAAPATAEGKLDQIADESVAEGAGKAATAKDLAKERASSAPEPVVSAAGTAGALADKPAAPAVEAFDSALAPAEQTLAVQFNAPAAAERLAEVLAANNIQLAEDDSDPEAPPELLARDRKELQASRSRSIQQIDDRQQTAVLIEGSPEAVSNVIATLDNDRANFSNFRAASPAQQQLALAAGTPASASSVEANQDRSLSKSFGRAYGGFGGGAGERFGGGRRENEAANLAGKKIAAAGRAWFFVLPVTAVKQWTEQQSAGAASQGPVPPAPVQDRRADEQRRDQKGQKPAEEQRMRALIFVDPPAPKS